MTGSKQESFANAEMSRPKKIIVATDFLDNPARAVYYAAMLAHPRRSQITLLHVTSPFEYDPNHPERKPSSVKSLTRNIQKMAQEKLGSFKDVPKELAIHCEMVRGFSPGEEILSHAAEGEYDLIVMRASGRAGVKQLLLGSISEKVIRRATCPVLVLPYRTEKRPKPPNIRKIVVPLDFSENSRRILDFIVPLARAFRASLEFLHVIDEYVPAYQTDSPEAYIDSIPRLREKSHEALLKFVSGWLPARVKHEFHTRAGKVYREILTFARDTEADIIAMTTHGQGGIDHLLLGSITQKIIRTAETPVLTIAAVSS